MLHHPEQREQRRSFHPAEEFTSGSNGGSCSACQACTTKDRVLLKMMSTFRGNVKLYHAGRFVSRHIFVEETCPRPELVKILGDQQPAYFVGKKLVSTIQSGFSVCPYTAD